MNAQTTAKQTSKMSQIGKTRYMVQVAMLGAAAEAIREIAEEVEA